MKPNTTTKGVRISGVIRNGVPMQVPFHIDKVNEHIKNSRKTPRQKLREMLERDYQELRQKNDR